MNQWLKHDDKTNDDALLVNICVMKINVRMHDLMVIAQMKTPTN